MKKNIFIAFFICFVVSACGVLNQGKALMNCEFKLASIGNISAAGISLQNITNLSSLNIMDAAKIAAAFSQNTFPMRLTANIDVKNPNPEKAGLTRMDWILVIDNMEVLNGNVDQKVEVEPNGGTSSIPLSVEMDLKKIFAGKSQATIMDFGLGLAGNNPETNKRIALKIKPYFNIAGAMIPYPGYISLSR
ncbi:MAG: hypothetical protein EAZ97_10950 [Bacteroidetes bacterium]|nr:MAG: hypothetical protein EAZ97_10950 [Bacteroidota bacterium]